MKTKEATNQLMAEIDAISIELEQALIILDAKVTDLNLGWVLEEEINRLAPIRSRLSKLLSESNRGQKQEVQNCL